MTPEITHSITVGLDLLAKRNVELTLRIVNGLRREQTPLRRQLAKLESEERKLVGDTLAAVMADQGQAVPDGLASWDVSDNGETLTLRIAGGSAPDELPADELAEKLDELHDSMAEIEATEPELAEVATN
jgi:hypothetical protein